MCFSCFFCNFLNFFWTSLKLKLVEVDKGFLQNIGAFYIILGAICFGNPNKNTQILIFTIFFKLF